MNTPVFADVGIPSPATIVLQSASISVGKLKAVGNDVYLNIEHTLKGSKIDGQRLLLVDPTNFHAFDLIGFAKTRKTDPVIALGNLDMSAGTFSLRWLHASLWPPNPQFLTFPSDRFDDCRAFVDTVIGYEQMGAKDPVQLANALIQDVDSAQVYAALDFADVAWATHAKRADADLVRLVSWAMYAKVLAKPRDPHVEQKVVSMFPLLPASVAIPDLLRIATATEAGVARSRVEALFRAKGMTQGKKLSVVELESIFQTHRSTLRRQDAVIALRMFDSQSTAVLASADLTLEKILGASLSGDGAKKSLRMRKSLWEREIDKLSD